jgi:hypothetical protein
MNSKSTAIILIMLGAAVAVWAFTRVTSPAGQLYTWEPPFAKYELTTLLGFGVAVVLLTAGLIKLGKSLDDRSLGIIMTVLSVAAGLWTFTRATNLPGQLQSLQPAFTEYEATTLFGFGVAVVLLTAGLIKLGKSLDDRIMGIIMLGAAAGLWTLTRATNLSGQLQSGQQAFTEYEATTLIGFGVAGILLTAGLIKLGKSLDDRSLGIIMTVLGAAAGLWTFARVTNLVGQLQSWQPPFTEYELMTLIVGSVAVVLLIVGLIKLTKKPSS